jgi:hypothetical protein
MLQMEAMEFRRLLRHATMNVITMKEAAEQDEPEPLPRLPWLRRSRKRRSALALSSLWGSFKSGRGGQRGAWELREHVRTIKIWTHSVW